MAGEEANSVYHVWNATKENLTKARNAELRMIYFRTNDYIHVTLYTILYTDITDEIFQFLL